MEFTIDAEDESNSTDPVSPGSSDACTTDITDPCW